MKLLHTPTGEPLEISDDAVFYLLKNGYAINHGGKLTTDAAPEYIEYLIQERIKLP